MMEVSLFKRHASRLGDSTLSTGICVHVTVTRIPLLQLEWSRNTTAMSIAATISSWIPAARVSPFSGFPATVIMNYILPS